MKVLVTGSAGFIGYHLVERLLGEGFSVVGIDNLNDYYSIDLKFGRLLSSGIDAQYASFGEKLVSTKNGNYTFLRGDLRDKSFIHTLFVDGKFDFVVNLAAQAGVRYSIENPQAYIDSNVTGFLNILEASRQFEIKHLIYASSSSVYGLSNEDVFKTSQSVDHPVSLYAATKRSNELMAHVYSNMYSLPVTGLRFFTVYGPWGRPDMAPMLFTEAILKNKEISVFNNGDMRRDFTYIDDIVNGIYRVIELIPKGSKEMFLSEPSPSNSQAPYSIYNIGNNSPTKLLDFINILEKELGMKAMRKYLPMQPGDVYSTYADVSPLIKDVGYKPATSLEQGIKKFIEWYKLFYMDTV